MIELVVVCILAGVVETGWAWFEANPKREEDPAEEAAAPGAGTLEAAIEAELAVAGRAAALAAGAWLPKSN